MAKMFKFTGQSITNIAINECPIDYHNNENERMYDTICITIIQRLESKYDENRLLLLLQIAMLSAQKFTMLNMRSGKQSIIMGYDSASKVV